MADNFDDMLPPSDEGTGEITNNGDVSLPDMPSEDKKVEKTDGDQPETEKEEPKETPTEDKTEEPKKSPVEDKKETPKEEEEEELDLGDLLQELSDNEDSIKKSDDAIANIEKDGVAKAEDVAVLKEENARLSESLKRMDEQLRKLMNDKSDLIFKNAELEAFGGDSSDPQMLMLTRNLEKAKSGDDRAKSKAVSILKDKLTELTGEDYDSKQTEKKVDLLSAAESYNKSSNPTLKDKKSEDDSTLVM